MLFSFFGFTFLIFLSYKLSFEFDNIFGFEDLLFEAIKTNLDNLVPGKFGSMDEVYLVIDDFETFFKPIFLLLSKNITFNGTLMFGDIFAPTLSTLSYKFISFFVILILLSVVVKIFEIIISLIIKKTGLSPVNRFFGLILGYLKGVMLSSIIFFLLSFLSSFGLSENLTNFINSGYFSKLVYDRYIVRLFENVVMLFK